MQNYAIPFKLALMNDHLSDEEIKELWIAKNSDEIANEFVKRGITDPRICKHCAAGPNPCERWRDVKWK